MLAACAGLAAALVFAEIALRILGVEYPPTAVFDPLCGTRRVPNSYYHHSGEGPNRTIFYNNHGYRDIDREQTKSTGTFRVAVLGDSIIEAVQVDTSDRVTEVLERELHSRKCCGNARAEVLNFGMSGYGTTQELQTLRYVVADFHPDLVILAFLTGNDLRNNSEELQSDPGRPYLVRRGDEYLERPPVAESTSVVRDVGRFLLGWSRVCQLANRVRVIRNRRREIERRSKVVTRGSLGDELGLDDAIYVPPADDSWRDAWNVSEELVRRVRDETNRIGAQLLVVVLSNSIQVHPDKQVRAAYCEAHGFESLNYPESRLEEAARRDKYELICLAPPMLAYAEQNNAKLHGFGDGFGHWNELGHKVAAELIAERVCRMLAPGTRTSSSPDSN